MPTIKCDECGDINTFPDEHQKQIFCSTCNALITTVVDVNAVMKDIIEEENEQEKEKQKFIYLEIAKHSSTPEKDMVDHPDHYNTSSIEVIAAIDAWNLGFCLGNAVKYIARAEHKDNKLEDLKKARWYLNHEIEKLEPQRR